MGTVLLRWIKSQLKGHEFSHNLTEVSQCFTQGEVLVTLIHRYRPDLVDITTTQNLTPEELNDIAFNIFERELSIPRVMSAKDSINLDIIDKKIWLNYLEQICELFRGEIPHVKHPKLDFNELKEKPRVAANVADFSKLLKYTSVKKLPEPIAIAQQQQQVQSSSTGRRHQQQQHHDERETRRTRKTGSEHRNEPGKF